jgi:hypothetical protein
MTTWKDVARAVEELEAAVTRAEDAVARLGQDDDVCSLDDQPFDEAGRCPLGHTREESDAYEAHCARFIHDCPRDVFLDDPITQAYECQGMVSLVACPVCDQLEADV